MLNIDETVDSWLAKKSVPTYEEVCTFGFDRKDDVEKYVKNRWVDLKKNGITLRTNKINKLCEEVRFVPPSQVIPNSLWKVTHTYYKAKKGFENFYPHSSSFSTLGWVLASTENEARTIAKSTLGPRAFLDKEILVIRKGISTLENVDSLNKVAAENAVYALEKLRNYLSLKKWEYEMLACQICFLKGEDEFNETMEKMPEVKL